MYTFLAVDSASHVAEEVPNPSRTVPHTMGMTMLIGIVTVIPWTLAFMFSTQDFDTVGSNAVPITEVYYQTLRDSKPATAVFTTRLILIYFGACLACTVTTGRLIWALASDKGMVYSSTFSKVHRGPKVPVNATIFTGVFCALYGLIYIGSTTAFNSFIATAILFLNVTYAIPQAIVLFNGWKKTLPARYLDLGSVFGLICNLFSMLWVSLFTVIFCFPIFLPVTMRI
jgi:choline transport protein